MHILLVEWKTQHYVRYKLIFIKNDRFDRIWADVVDLPENWATRLSNYSLKVSASNM